MWAMFRPTHATLIHSHFYRSCPTSIFYLQLSGTGAVLNGWHDAGSRQRVSELVTVERPDFQSGVSTLDMVPLILTMLRHCDSGSLVQQHLAHRDP